MTQDPFERLLQEMPRIAEAVNAFTSPQIQQLAFHALTAALGTPPPPMAPSTHSPTTDTARQILTRALAVFEAADDTRVHSATLAAEFGMTQTDLAALLRPYGVLTLPNKFARNGTEARGYERAAFEQALTQLT